MVGKFGWKEEDGKRGEIFGGGSWPYRDSWLGVQEGKSMLLPETKSHIGELETRQKRGRDEKKMSMASMKWLDEGTERCRTNGVISCSRHPVLLQV